MATPPKSGARKATTKRASPARVSASPVVKAKPVAAPKAEKVEVVPTEAPSIDWPVAVMPASPEPESHPEPEVSVPTPLLADAVDPLPDATAETTKGKTDMTDVLETAKTYADEAKTRFQSSFVEANERAKAALEKSSRAFEELGELTRGNLEAVVESSKIAAKGVEALGQDAAEFGRKSFEKTSATMKSFAAVKTPAEFFQLQSELLSATLDSFAKEASKNSEAFLKLAGDISAPISNRVSVVTEKMKSLAA